MNKMICHNYGNIIETIPLCCGHDMVVNEKTGDLECYMGPNCGYMKLTDLLCEKCSENICK